MDRVSSLRRRIVPGADPEASRRESGVASVALCVPRAGSGSPSRPSRSVPMFSLTALLRQQSADK